MSRTGAQTRQRIIEVATELFGREGFGKITIKQIASRLHISEPAVYRYFETKEVLSEAVLGNLMDQFKSNTLFDELAGEKDVSLLLKRIASHIIELFTHKEELYRLLLYSSLSSHPYARRVYGAIRGTYSTFLRHQLDRLYEQKRIRRVNNQITARCFIGMVFDCALTNTLWKGMHEKVFAPKETIANNVGIYARGLELRVSSED